MAEKYGTIPKRFTKEWWEYFWDYYKIHTIASIIVILLIVMTIYQVRTSPKYDFNITYTGSQMFFDDEVDQIKSNLEQYIDDIDGNGEKSIFFQQIVFEDDNNQEPQYQAAMLSKLQLEFVTNDTMLFIFDETKKDNLFNEGLDGAFMNVNDWCDEKVSDELLFCNNNVPYAVRLDNSKFLSGLSVPSESLYIAVRANTKDSNNETYELSKKIANLLIK